MLTVGAIPLAVDSEMSPVWFRLVCRCENSVWTHSLGITILFKCFDFCACEIQRPIGTSCGMKVFIFIVSFMEKKVTVSHVVLFLGWSCPSVNDRPGKCVPVKLSPVIDRCLRNIMTFHELHSLSATLFLWGEPMAFKEILW